MKGFMRQWMKCFGFAAALMTVLLCGCAGPVKMATRSALDDEPEPQPVTIVNRQAPAAGTLEGLTVNEIPPGPPRAGEQPPPAPAEMVVTIQTSFGEIVIELFDRIAPKTSANFRKLVQEGFYNHLTFHRVVPGFVIQGGDPLTRFPKSDRAQHGTGGPGYTLPSEQSLPHRKGAVAAARLDNDVNPKRESHGSQFYICLADLPTLDGEYTVFGQVVQGMDAVEKIAAVPADDQDNPRDRVEMDALIKPRNKVIQ